MFVHPAFIMVPFLAVLKACKGRSLVFRASSLIMPLVVWLFLILEEGERIIEFSSLKIIWEGDQYSKIVGSAFLIVLIVANAYAIGQKRYAELVVGSAYAAAALLSVMAKDFVSMFVGIELMLISASILIFIGSDKLEDGVRAAKRYLLTHVSSSSMIIIGVVHVISKNNSSEIVSITELFNNPSYSSGILYLMFTGFVINIAAFPFSGWMVNYYRKASASGFLYLISFTTKVSIILLLKLFAGFEYLKYVALLMILYGGVKAVFENNIFSLLSYLSIISMGVMALVIGYGDKEAMFGVVCYLFIHIIYKLCLSLVAAVLRDYKGIVLCSEIGSIKSKMLFTLLVIGLLLIINTPFALTFYSKLVMSKGVSNGFFYGLILLANLFTIIALPWKYYIKSDEINVLKINYYNNLSVFMAALVAAVIGFAGFFLPIFSTLTKVYEVNDYINDILKQFVLFFISVIFLIKLKNLRKSGKALNLLEVIGNICFHLYNRFWKNKDTETVDQENWNIEVLENQLLQKISVFHNQQTAIFMAFVLLIIMIIILL